MSVYECIGWYPSDELLRSLEVRGYSQPWEMPQEEFRRFAEGLTLSEGAAEFERIAHALYMDEELPTAMATYGRHFAQDNAYLRRFFGVRDDDPVLVYRGLGRKDPHKVIRPGDWVALDARYARTHGKARGGQVLSGQVAARDVVWARTDANEWFYAPRACRQPGLSLYEYLLGYAEWSRQ